MSQPAAQTLGAPTWRDYVELCKPRVVMLIVFTAVVGMFLATPGMVSPVLLLSATLGRKRAY